MTRRRLSEREGAIDGSLYEIPATASLANYDGTIVTATGAFDVAAVGATGT